MIFNVVTVSLCYYYFKLSIAGSNYSAVQLAAIAPVCRKNSPTVNHCKYTNENKKS